MKGRYAHPMYGTGRETPVRTVYILVDSNLRTPRSRNSLDHHLILTRPPYKVAVQLDDEIDPWIDKMIKASDLPVSDSNGAETS